jgi:hypothetical protein
MTTSGPNPQDRTGEDPATRIVMGHNHWGGAGHRITLANRPRGNTEADLNAHGWPPDGREGQPVTWRRRRAMMIYLAPLATSLYGAISSISGHPFYNWHVVVPCYLAGIIAGIALVGFIRERRTARSNPPMHDIFTANVGRAHARWLADPDIDTPGKFDLPGITDNLDGTVSFGQDTRNALRDLPEEVAGHLDNTGRMWIEGSGYYVESVS